jgi:hypothetical protein
MGAIHYSTAHTAAEWRGNAAGRRVCEEFKEPSISFARFAATKYEKCPENLIFSIETMNLTIKLTVISIVSVKRPIVFGGLL